jgi:hypothetical protein
MIGPAEERDMEYECVSNRIADLDALIEGAPGPCAMVAEADEERRQLIRRKAQLERIFAGESR